MNKNNLFWNFIKSSGKDCEKINETREYYLDKYGKESIELIDSQYDKYNNFFQSKIDPILNDTYDDSNENYDNFFQHILSKGENNFNKLLSNKYNKKNHTINMGDFDINYEIDEVLFDDTSEYQHIQVFSTKNLGNILSIDNDLQISEKDENIYHEMISNVPINYFNKNINILVLGGGDGGVAREALKHNNVDKVTIIELDKMVVDVTKKYFKNLSNTFDNERLELKIQDGIKFVEEYTGPKFDIIIMDLTDFGQSNPLHELNFYKKLIRLCNDDYIICFNFDNFDKIENENMYKKLEELKTVFKFVNPYGVYIPTFGGGYYSFCLLSNTVNPRRDINWRYFKNKKLELEYYTPKIHISSFIFPSYIESRLNKILNKNVSIEINQEVSITNNKKNIYHSIIDIEKLNKNLLKNGNIIDKIIDEFLKDSSLKIKDVNSDNDNYIIFNFTNGNMSIYVDYEKNSLYIDLFLFGLENKSIITKSINNIVETLMKIDKTIKINNKILN